ncbi:MAG: hypothetical protein KDD82_26570 [Planctomycetes bacterium]|nr:hypothetical protein [Planctomycetota bacterium]
MRRDDGGIERVLRKALDLESPLERGSVPALREGDEVLLESAAGKLRGKLGANPDGEQLTLRLNHGQELKVERSKLQAISLLFGSEELVGGVRFMVKSKSGNAYEGTVGQVLPDRRALVKLLNGRTVDLRLDRLQLDTLVLSLPVPVDDTALVAATELLAAPLPEEVEVAQEQALAREPSKQVEDALARERRSARLLRQQLQEVLAERERLETDMKERERALESEVWRGMATNRDLSDAKKRLRELEDEIQRRSSEQQEQEG